MNRMADVCIVGMGAAGGILAKQLGSAGMDVVVLERGGFQPYADYAHKDSIRAVPRRGLEPTVNGEPLLFRPGPGQPLRPLLSSNPTNAVGGALTFWTGMAARFTPGDFRVRSDEIDSGAAGRAGADLSGYDVADWPIGYQDLEPHYERFEWEFGVSGDDTANPFAPPRRRGYPLPPLRQGACNDLFAKACRALGYHPYPNPNGILSKPYRPPARYDGRIAKRKACTYCAHCHDYGCHVHAKAASLYTVIPVALQTGKVRLETGCKVVRVNLDAKGQARSVSYHDRDEKPREQRARLVILAGYVFENSRLLLVSRTERGPHRRGLGNQGDQVGRCLMAHNDLIVMGLFEDRLLNGFIGPLTAGQRIDDLYGNHFDHGDLGFIRGAGIGAAAGGTPIDKFPFVPPGVPRWGAAYKEFLIKYYNRSFALSIQPETLPHPENRVTLHPRRRDKRGLPVPVVTFCLHSNEQRLQRFLIGAGEKIMRATGANHYWSMPVPVPYRWAGGTRMGKDPLTSVVDAQCRVHGIDNLFVIGASVFPTITSFPATATVSALAYRASATIVREHST